MSILISILAFIVAIGLLVTVHEFGHFWVARRVGVKVLRFSVGFGRPLWRRTARDGTEYVIAALPLGGYVKMLDEREIEVPEGQLEQAFNRKPLWARTAVVAAGPAFNFLFAILAYWLIFMLGVPGLKPVLGAPPPDTPAARAGILQGDVLQAVNAEPVATWEAATLEMLDALLDGDAITLTLDRNGAPVRVVLERTASTRELTEPGALMQGFGLRLDLPPLPAVLGEILPDSPAAQAGLQSGDRVLAVEGQPVEDFLALAEFVRARPGQVLDFRIERAGRELEIPVAVASREAEGETLGRIGAAPARPTGYGEHLRIEHRLGPLAALTAGVSKTGEISLLTLRLLGRMLVGDVSLKNISGPVNIAQYAGFTASSGLVPFLAFLAVISVSLGVLNLLPIPVLDGGHLAWFAVEAIKGSPVSERTELLGQKIGIAMLVLLMGFAFYNDIARLLN